MHIGIAVASMNRSCPPPHHRPPPSIAIEPTMIDAGVHENARAIIRARVGWADGMTIAIEAHRDPEGMVWPHLCAADHTAHPPPGEGGAALPTVHSQPPRAEEAAGDPMHGQGSTSSPARPGRDVTDGLSDRAQATSSAGPRSMRARALGRRAAASIVRTPESQRQPRSAAAPHHGCATARSRPICVGWYAGWTVAGSPAPCGVSGVFGTAPHQSTGPRQRRHAGRLLLHSGRF